MPISNPPQPAANSNGAYTGDNTVNRAIPHGLAAVPRLVIIASQAAEGWFRILSGSACVYMVRETMVTYLAVTAMDSSNFYIGNATSQANSANFGARDYLWVAIR